ncbi:hypothetical protein H6F86_00390 [Phormidium sp. FACHB-592]|uniref:Uncharacterized protein n=1 Tax=Stenomitos frigidus AS-A4 TaxID=2933935 RepID=A0ABV0KSV7_9CYAN|nr:hypothetical protein [Phormidium sp. FACHB-592]MBD2072392.1 hypothetical protein [Phormidium sp. FACHB-592]
MHKVYPVAKRETKMRRSPVLKPKFKIGQRVEVRWEIDEEPNGISIDRGVVQGFAYISGDYECTSRSGYAPSPGFSYSILFGGYAIELVNENELFLAEEALCV